MANPYVKNKDLREQLIISREQDELTKEALEMIMLMADRFSRKFVYYYEEDRKDCIAFGILDVYLRWRGYNPEKSANAFAYITQIIKNGFAKGWRTLYGNMPKSSKISISSGKIFSL